MTKNVKTKNVIFLELNDSIDAVRAVGAPQGVQTVYNFTWKEETVRNARRRFCESAEISTLGARLLGGLSLLSA